MHCYALLSDDFQFTLLPCDIIVYKAMVVDLQ